MTWHPPPPMDPYGPSVLTIQVHPGQLQQWEEWAELEGFTSVSRWVTALANKRAGVDRDNFPKWE